MKRKPTHSWKGNLRHDIPAGLVVFLVAIPLCLGVALASKAPLMAGLISGAIAGLIVSWISGSELSVSGPAAGLTAVVAMGIERLGSFEALCSATLMAGFFQILFGLIGIGSIAGVFPLCVIKGMLTAIGIIIVLKQIPHALGRDVDFEGDLGFWEHTGENTFTDIMKAFLTATPGPILICVFALGVILFWDTSRIKSKEVFKFLPGPLMAVIGAIILNKLFLTFIPSIAVTDATHLVSLPTFNNLGEFFGQFRSPDFSAFKSLPLYSIALTIAAIGSVETLLSIEATDRLDPFRRMTSDNRELVAQGIGNSLSGLLGGLPMTSLIVRNSSNIYAGARTRMSSFVHGLLLLAAVLIAPKFLNLVPLSAIAAILLIIGFRLARASVFLKLYRAGLDQFLPFIVTVLAIMFTDLVSGVLLGLLVGFLVVIWSNHYSSITMVNEDLYYLIKFTKDVSFINKIKLKKLLASIPNNSKLLIDGGQARFIDADIMEIIAEFKDFGLSYGIEVEIKNIEGKHYPKKLKRLETILTQKGR